jgi:hypothetical protein
LVDKPITYGTLPIKEKEMKRLRIYDIVMESGEKSLNDIVLEMQNDFDWTDVFFAIEQNLTFPVDSYSYEEIY